MNSRNLIAMMISCLFSSLVFANDGYEGEGGTKGLVFETSCLFCHSSTLSGSARNGAPPSVNFDTYETAVMSAGRAVERAAVQMTMPPGFSGIAPLTDEQKTAMFAWEEAGFPRYQSMASFSFATQKLIVPVVLVGEQKFFAELKLIETEASPFGIGFELLKAGLNTDTIEMPASFNPQDGTVELPEVQVMDSSEGPQKVSAMLTQIATEPLEPLKFFLSAVMELEDMAMMAEAIEDTMEKMEDDETNLGSGSGGSSGGSGGSSGGSGGSSGGGGY